MSGRAWACWLLALLGAPAIAQDGSEELSRQWAEYERPGAKTVLELQPYRSSQQIESRDRNGRPLQVALVSLNPVVNSWYLLTLVDAAGAAQQFHLENARPATQRLKLANDQPDGLLLEASDGGRACPLWGTADWLSQARASGLAYAPLCGGALFLRNAVRGTYTQIERTTNFLRDYVWGGEKIVVMVRDRFFSDAYRQPLEAGPPVRGAAAALPNAPRPAQMNPAAAGRDIVAQGLGLSLEGAGGSIRMGRWYAVQAQPGLFVSAIAPEAIASPVFVPNDAGVAALDDVEASALDYLVAFDLDAFELGFAVGTDHPRVDWSTRPPRLPRDAALPGPDGIGSIAPLVANGMISPAVVSQVAAAFTGGFKREHGAFRAGELARQNHGSHYGFIEQGTILSKLQPGLSTLYVLDDGRVDMKTWTASDEALLPRVRHARQNGVAVLEHDADSDRTRPGPLLTRWELGNWSGSKDSRLRTLRAGACIEQSGARRFLIYGYFSSATPSAMARVFQAYHCRYAMHLDMNALEHTYLAIYTHRGRELQVQHLIEGMSVVDRKGGAGALAPRFIGFPDDRDFFYLLRKRAP